VLPFVQESVFRHHPGLRVLLSPASRIDLFGLDGGEHSSGLPGISERLLEAATPHQSIGGNRGEIIAKLMERIGLVQRRQREAGSWVIDEEPLGEGEGGQDWPAFHWVATTDRARIRFMVIPPGATADKRTRVRRIAEHVSGISIKTGGRRPGRRARGQRRAVPEPTAAHIARGGTPALSRTALSGQLCPGEGLARPHRPQQLRNAGWWRRDDRARAVVHRPGDRCPRSVNA
jgi:hypothetical protein